MLKLLIATVTLAALCAAPAAGAKEQSFKPSKSGQIEFMTPSGNIGCLYTPEGGTDVYDPLDGGPELICDRVEPDYVRVILGPEVEAEAIFDPGEQPCCSGPKFNYDNELELDGFICHSETTGLVCQTTNGEHGFLMSKAHIVTY
ncbi:MAG: hypothetical protein ABIY37_12735 [Devosia sp.]